MIRKYKKVETLPCHKLNEIATIASHTTTSYAMNYKFLEREPMTQVTFAEICVKMGFRWPLKYLSIIA